MMFDESWRGVATEKRSDGYTGLLTRQLIADAEGFARRDPSAIGAAEACVGAYARAFSLASVTPATSITAALTPAVLSLMVRNMLRTGESVHYLSMPAGKLTILPAGSHNVHGGPDPAGWWYRVTTYGPSGSETVLVPATDVIHAMYSCHPHRPWQGVSPLAWASSTGRLAAELEDHLADESATTRGYLLPMPTAGSSAGTDADVEDDTQSQLRSDIKALKGKTVFVESTSGGFGEGPHAAPASGDWRPQRLGVDPPEAAVDLRSGVAQAVISCYGIPPQLFLAAGATPLRECVRIWLHSGISPISSIVTAELREKLNEPRLELNFDKLYASDITSRSRALGQMVTAGVPLDEARRLAGLE